jgi:phage terminase large subunit-like protein
MRSRIGELAWPERYPRTALASYRRNQFLWAGQYQQSPTPRGGGIFKEDWFQPYEVPADGQWDIQPEFALASLDTAFKESEENDYTALTIWWVYDHPKTGQRRIMLVDGWQKRLPLNGKFVQRRNDEDERAYLRRASKDWGVVEWVNYTCTKRNVDRLLIEDSARGYDVSRELQRVFGDATWGTLLVPARGEKWIRAHAVVDLFTNEMIYAPGQWTCGTHGTLKGKCECPAERFGWEWRDWAQDIIHQICRFPRGAHDDLVDSMTMALRHLREQQLAMRREERVLMEKEMNTYRKPLPPVYEA